MFFLFITFAVVIAYPHFDLNQDDPSLFKQFSFTYKKSYSTPSQFLRRYSIFKKNVETIRERNAERQTKHSATFAINAYSDLLPHELPISKMTLETIKQSSIKLPNNNLKQSVVDSDYRNIDLPDGDNLPTMLSYCGSYVSDNTERAKVDFCGQQFNQGSCGCCYAAATSNLGQILYVNQSYSYNNDDITAVTKPLFAVQQFIDETQTSVTRRCCGGNPQDILEQVPYFVLESDYGFIDSDNLDGCTARGSQGTKPQKQLLVNKYKMFVTSGTNDEKVLQLKKILHHYGPFLSAIRTEADSAFQSYGSGIFKFSDESECQLSLDVPPDHQIVVVGYGVEDGVEYFIIRNSWYDSWGEDGNYMRLDSSVLCGIGMDFGTYVRPLNGIIYTDTCELDKDCGSCNSDTLICGNSRISIVGVVISLFIIFII
ncbi:Cysteine protease [Entamoeba marina]